MIRIFVAKAVRETSQQAGATTEAFFLKRSAAHDAVDQKRGALRR
ncbi:MAG: hypothetical protein AB1586_30210 [Pseudomonadota bacterium]